MKILKLVSENVKMLRAVEITPDGHFQIISGRNEQGKTSVLDSIWYALGGKKAMEDTDEPIRRGETQANVTLDMGDIVVTRRWKGVNTTLDVRTKDGAKYSSPQKVLDSMIGRLSFDPLAFASLEDKKQVATLQELTGFNPEELDRWRQTHFDERTIVNREVDRLKLELKSIVLPVGDVPEEEVSVTDILAEMKKAQDLQRKNDDIRKEYADLDYKIAGYELEVQGIDDQIAKLQAKKAQVTDAWDQTEIKMLSKKMEVDQLVDPDLDNFQTKLELVEETNRDVRAKLQYTEVSKKLADKEAESKALTTKIEGVDQQKLDQLKKTVFPIEGLGFGTTGLTYNDIPFKQCSSAQRLKVSMAMAMALNPQVRIIRILNGNLLDSANLAVIREMAQEKDYQVWVEIVDETGHAGITIEDGMVKNNDDLPS